jgi:hypothetical protein
VIIAGAAVSAEPAPDQLDVNDWAIPEKVADHRTRSTADRR